MPEKIIQRYRSQSTKSVSVSQSPDFTELLAEENENNTTLPANVPKKALSTDSTSAEEKEEITTIIIQATSAGFDAGNQAKITVNGAEVDPEKNENDHFRGLHVALINPHDGEVSWAQVFDTYKESTKLDAFIKTYIPEGYIIVAACKDDCVTELSEEAKKWFEDMGSS